MNRLQKNISAATIERDLIDYIEFIRKKNAFNSALYITKKSALLNEYMRSYNLQGCIVGVSGGIDSAVVLGLIQFAKKQKDSPITSVLAVPMPTFSDGSSNQKDALARGREVCRTFSVAPTVLDLTCIHSELKKLVDSALAERGNHLSSGQLVSYLRTPALYYLSSIMAQHNVPSIVCGTTNYDESSYVGYYAKAADGMVDVQLISDIHKSEVNMIAKALGVPKRIIDTPPSADLYHGKTDEEIFGFSYDFLELYLEYLALPAKKQREYFSSWSMSAQRQFIKLGKLVEKFHSVGLHKYLGASPSVHLNIIKRSVPGGLVSRGWLPKEI
jgi:NAD+ synthetase